MAWNSFHVFNHFNEHFSQCVHALKIHRHTSANVFSLEEFSILSMQPTSPKCVCDFAKQNKKPTNINDSLSAMMICLIFHTHQFI